MSVKLTIHSVGNGQDSLTGKQAEGVTVSFKDGPQKFLSWKSLKGMICYELPLANVEPSIPMAAAK